MNKATCLGCEDPLTHRRAGQRLRIEARRRRNEVFHQLGWHLLFATLVWFAVTAGLGAYLYLFFERDGLFFALGAGVGGYAVMVLVTFQLLDPVGARIYSGLEGETNTAKELHRLRSAGWQAIHNVHLKGGDVDHVAVGPGGVVAIETKASSADWSFLERQGVLNRWADQARMGAVRVKGLTKQYAGTNVDPVPLVSVWSPGGRAAASASTIDGVIRIHGSQLRDHLLALPEVLDSDAIKSIVIGLERASRQFDHASGIRHPGRLRRMLGVQTVG